MTDFSIKETTEKMDKFINKIGTIKRQVTAGNWIFYESLDGHLYLYQKGMIDIALMDDEDVKMLKGFLEDFQ